MANYTTKDGYAFDAQINYGWGLTLNMTGKAPEVSKRIFDTYEHMLYYVNDYNDSCVEGLCLKVMADGDKNGVYFVTKIGTNAPVLNEDGSIKVDDKGQPVLSGTFANDGEVVKLGSDARIIAAEADIKAIEDALGELPSGTTIAQMFVDEATARNNAIKEAIEALDVAEMADEGKYVSKVSEADGKVSVEFKAIEASEVLVADAEGQFEGETVEAVLAEIENNLELSASTLYNMLGTAADTFDAALSAETDAREAEDAAIRAELISAETRLNEAIEEAQAAAEAAATIINEKAEGHVTVSGVQDAETKAWTYTVSENDIASATALTAEIAAREEAISALTKTHNEDKAELEKAIEDEVSARTEAVKVEKERAEAKELELNNAITAETKAREEAVSAETKAREEAVSAETKAREEAISALTKTHNDDKAELEKAIEDEAKRAGDEEARIEGKFDDEVANLKDLIDGVSADAKSYSVATVTGDELSALGTNVKEAYKLVDEDGAKAGEYIKIYKDSSLEKVELSGQNLVFTYITANGGKDVVSVDVSAFLTENEYADGLKVVNHVISVKLAEGSESFLTVDANGIKLSGVQAAIDAAVKAEKERAISAETELNNAITAETAAREAKDTELNNAITAETAAREAKDTELNNAITAETAAREAKDTELNNAITAETAAREEAVSAETKAREEAISAETKAREEAISALTKTHNDDKAELEKAIEDAEKAAKAAATIINEKAEGHVTVSGVQDAETKAWTYTVSENDIASASGVAAQFTALTETVENNKTDIENKLASAKTELNNAITAERDRAVSAETDLQTAINNEAARAASAETDLQTAINNEAARAASAETANANAIADEAARATSAETALSERIEDLEAVSIVGKDAIVVSEGDEKEISLKLVEGPAEGEAGIGLAQDANGLKATLYWGSF